MAVTHDCSRRYLDDQILAAAPEAVGSLAMFASGGLPVPLVRKVSQIRMSRASTDDHAAAVPAIAAVRAAARRVLFTAEAQATVTPSPSLHEYRDPVNEHGVLSERADQPLAGAGATASGSTLMRRPPWSKWTFPSINEKIVQSRPTPTFLPGRHDVPC
jgi:hypothetical protein